ncbi:PQQ-dependent sugar dehydrogenase [Pendulispora albinea]|uniref:PQQ-dependent sugar dehydrogenase n=1 Tax=Pendulispora albinea TaxID=2741071 RepID=A0ABZ2LS79_9BACT
MRWLVLPAAMLAGFLACSDSSDDPRAPDTPPAPDGSSPPPVNCVGTTPYDAWTSDPKLCVYVFGSGLGEPRQMAFAPNGDLFVSNGRITVLWDADGNGRSDADERATFATAPGLNHGLAFSPQHDYLYASSPEAVYRWRYASGSHTASGPPEVVIANIPGGGSHVSRTLVFDSQGRLYVNVGSFENLDTKPSVLETRSQIRRFVLPASIPTGGIDYANGEVVARGMRNEVGLFVDAKDRLWGVENGRENVSDSSGNNIQEDNPAEEINLVDGRGSRFYGYPYCFSEFRLPHGRPGTEWADPTVPDAKSDGWCQDPANVRPPVFAMQAHWAPLGIFQYTGRSLPFSGDFLIASHGSWNRETPTGKLIARARYRDDAIVAVEPLIGAKDPSGALAQGKDGAPRPVDIRQGPDGAIYYSDDDGGRIFKVGYRAPGRERDASTDGAAAGDDCAPGEDGLPSHLRCTGLYADFVRKTLAAGVRAYEPGLQLWSDGAEKQRYLYLPPGSRIDTSNLDEWQFPVGTRAWKEFRIGGARVETRIYAKRGPLEWAWATYRWTPDESDAVRLDEGATNVAGSYEIPNHASCNKCHGGRTDKLLGVEAIALALPAAKGITLADLANVMTSPPPKTAATLPEDPTGKAGAALGYLHMNCGTACHNRNARADAFLSGFYTRLPARDVLEGAAVGDLDAWKTGANAMPAAIAYKHLADRGYRRILPHDAQKSLVVHVMKTRGAGQMPPLLSHQVDATAVDLLTGWIDAL